MTPSMHECAAVVRAVTFATLMSLTLVGAAVACAIDPQTFVANGLARRGEPQRTRAEPSSRDLSTSAHDAMDRSAPPLLDLSPSAIRKAIKDSIDPLEDVYAERTATFGGGKPGS